MYVFTYENKYRDIIFASKTKLYKLMNLKIYEIINDCRHLKILDE